MSGKFIGINLTLLLKSIEIKLLTQMFLTVICPEVLTSLGIFINRSSWDLNEYIQWSSYKLNILKALNNGKFKRTYEN